MSVEWPCKGRIETTFGVSRVRFLDFDAPSATQSAELHLRGWIHPVGALWPFEWAPGVRQREAGR